MAPKTIQNLQLQLSQVAAATPDLKDNEQWTNILAKLKHLLQELTLQEPLLDVTTAISNPANSIVQIDELLPTYVQLIKSHFHFKYVGIFLTDDTNHWIKLKADTDSDRFSEPCYDRIEDDSSIGQAIRRQAPWLSYETKEIIVPLSSRDQVIGVLKIQVTDPAIFSGEEFPPLHPPSPEGLRGMGSEGILALFLALADHLAGAIQNAGLLAGTDQQLEQLVTLYNINMRIGSHLDVDTLLNEVAQVSIKLINADAAIIRLVDPSNHSFTIKATYNLEKKPGFSPTEKFGLGLSTVVFQTHQPIAVNNWPDHPLARDYDQVAKDQFGDVLALLNVPMALQHEIIGTIEVCSRTRLQAFDESDLYILSLLASQTAIAVENARLLDQAEHNRRFLKTIIDHIPDPIFIKDKHHTWTEMNQANANVIGKPAQEMIGHTDQDYFSPELAQEFYRRDDEVIAANRIAEYEDKTVWADGKEHIAYTRLIPIPGPSGQPDYILGISHDVTERRAYELERERFAFENARLYEQAQQEIAERKRAEQESRANEKKYRELVENANSIIFRMDMQGRVTFFNKFAQAFFGYAEAEILGRHVLNTIVPEVDTLGQTMPEMVEGILRHTELYATNENENIRRNGDRVWISWTNKAILDDEGNVVEILCIGNDITERRKALIEREAIWLENRRLLREAQYRSDRLQTAAEVSRAASSILDLTELINTSVNLIRDQFNFYYVGLFLVDEAREWAVLRAGTGEAGWMQLNQGHRLKIGGESMIGWSIENRKARIALDVGQDAVRFKNPALPDTHSEMALPLVSAKEVLGALTVQSTEREAFSDEDITLLQTMADQLAIAIGNARLFESVLEAQAEAETRLQETLALQQLSAALASTLQIDDILTIFFEACTKEIGFEYIQLNLVDNQNRRIRAIAGFGVTESNIKRANRSLDSNDIMADIIRTGRTEIITGWDDRFHKETYEAEGHANWVRLFTPITLRQEHIGLVEAGFNKSTYKQLEETQVRLLKAFINQTALALDNAQRYETSLQSARRQALLKEVAVKVRASTDIETILQTTVKEVGDALKSKRTSIHLISEQS